MSVAVVLAGGRGLRMGGADKALITLHSQRVIDLILAKLRPQVDDIAVNANGDPSRFADLGLPVIADPFPDLKGPLAGVLAAMNWAKSRNRGSVLTVAGDTPFFPDDLAVRLREGADGGRTIALAASVDEQNRTVRHPTFGCWPVILSEELERALASGTRKVTAWADTQGARDIFFRSAGDPAFFNINTPEDRIIAQDVMSRLKVSAPRRITAAAPSDSGIAHPSKTRSI